MIIYYITSKVKYIEPWIKYEFNIDSECLTNNIHIWIGTAIPNTCPQFGNEFHPESYSSSDGLFLNVKSPSQCHRNVTEWKFCYRSGSTSRTYEVQFMLFRQIGSTQTYNRVTNSYKVYRRRGPPLVACTSISFIDPGEIFEVQPNDIIGACLRDQGSTHPLRVTIESPNEALHVTSINDDCRDNDLQSLNLGSLTTNNVLLVEAIISKLSIIIYKLINIDYQGSY